MGTPWHQQQLSCELADWIELFRTELRRQLLETGQFNLKDMDHNSPNYNRLSNKQLKIAANKMIAPREEDDYDECIKIVMRVCLGI